MRKLSRREVKQNQGALRNEGNFVSAILNAADFLLIPDEIAGVKAVFAEEGCVIDLRNRVVDHLAEDSSFIREGSIRAPSSF